jgi:hypothetical protein
MSRLKTHYAWIEEEGFFYTRCGLRFANRGHLADLPEEASCKKCQRSHAADISTGRDDAGIGLANDYGKR